MGQGRAVRMTSFDVRIRCLDNPANPQRGGRTIGRPGAGELPIAADTTASPATLYFWDGGAWVVTV